MKRVRNVIVILLLFFTVFVVVENRMPFAVHYYKTTAELNVRVGAGAMHPISFTLQKGEEVEVLSKKNTWYQIRYSEKIGYASSKFLRYSRVKFDIKLHALKQAIPSYIIIPAFVGIVLLVVLIATWQLRKRERQFHSSRRIQPAFRGQNLIEYDTKPDRGTWSERDLALRLLQYGIPAQAIFHDLYVAKSNGGFSQIDLLVVSAVGIIVFEVKDYSGWIFGSGKSSQWTKVLAYGKDRYRFYNPIMQNSKHIEDLKKYLKQVENVPFYSIVVFYGDCVLKGVNFVPNGTLIVKSNRVFEAMNSILKNNEPVQYANKDELLEVLKEAVKNGEDKEIQAQHVDNIKDMLGTDRIFD